MLFRSKLKRWKGPPSTSSPRQVWRLFRRSGRFDFGATLLQPEGELSAFLRSQAAVGFLREREGLVLLRPRQGVRPGVDVGVLLHRLGRRAQRDGFSCDRLE